MAGKRIALRAATGAVLVLAVAGGATLAGQVGTSPNVFVMVNSRQDKAADEKYGAQSHLAMREMMEHALFKAFKERYPCISSLDQSALGTMLDVERQRQLLGGAEDDSRLQAIGTAVGAQYVTSVDVRIVGDTVYFGGVVITSAKANAIARTQASSAAGNAAATAIEQFANRLVGSIGAGGPKCPGSWRGTVSFKDQLVETDSRNGSPYEYNRVRSGTCTIEKEGTYVTKCKSSFSSTTKETCRGKPCGGSVEGEGEGMPYVTVAVKGGKVTVFIDLFSIPCKTFSDVLGAGDVLPMGMGGWRVEGPASGSPDTQSGSQTVGVIQDSKLKAGTTITWNLTKK